MLGWLWQRLKSPFYKGKKQLEKIEVDWSRKLSLVRIHVERVIGILKQFYKGRMLALNMKMKDHQQ